VILMATPDDGSVLSSWSVAGCSAPGTCTVTMNATKNVTATFNSTCASRLVKLGASSYYVHIQDAYDVAPDGASVKMQAVDFSEDLLMQNDTSVKLQGGFNCAFTSNPDWSSLIGSMTVKGGEVTIEKIIIK
jgi:hypothetical protein